MENIVKEIAENYKKLEQSIIDQLLLKVSNHHLTTGTYREKVWKSLFRQIIPHKFAIEQGVFVIDSEGNVSREIDLAVFDEQYTPYIFNYGNIKFIPIEAVAIVIQCKSFSIDNSDLKKWTDSINKLKTSMNSIARMYTGVIHNQLNKSNETEGEQKEKVANSELSQTATRPLKILCHLKNQKTTDVKDDLFDIILCANEETRLLEKKIKENMSLAKWYKYLNHANPKFKSKIKKCKIKKTLLKYEIKENILLSLIFQLNQLLMLINNPMLFPHQSYVKMFNKKTKSSL